MRRDCPLCLAGKFAMAGARTLGLDDWVCEHVGACSVRVPFLSRLESDLHRETARQTAAVFGLDWGGGVYVNYAFIAAWMLDVIWWWRGLERYNQRPRYLVLAWQGFFLFMVFNAMVVFKAGALRWLGIGLCIALVLVWWMTDRPAIYADRKGIKA